MNHGLDYLPRADISVPLPSLIIQIAKEYNLGEYKDHQIIEEGYENLNIKLTTTTGDFIVKIFAYGRKKDRVEAYISVTDTLLTQNVPVPAVLQGPQGPIYTHKGKRSDTYICVTNYFHGGNLTSQEILDTDIQKIAQILARINSIQLVIPHGYDSWNVINFPNELLHKHHLLNKSESQILQSLSNEYSNLDTKKLTKGLIHCDLQREHILKSPAGDLCILDLGCVDYNYIIIDLAILIVQLIRGMNSIEKRDKIRDLITKAYTEVKPLSQYEMSVLPTIMKAQYEADYLQAKYYITDKKDTSQQTIGWYSFAKEGLSFFDISIQ